MRIISSFHDYYDGCLAYGADPKCVYLRELKEIENGKDWPAVLQLKHSLQAYRAYNRFFYASHYEAGCVWFCGQAFPFIIIVHKINYLESERIHCYNLEQLEEALLTYGSKEEKKNYLNPDRKKRATKGKFRAFFEENKWPEKEVTEFLCKLGVPCLAWRTLANWINDGYNLYLNPVLKEFQFYRIKNPFSAFQELSMFISGIMGGQAPPMVPISDEIRLEKHGFDKKWSFRKKVR
jgi:hypothetical protein